MGLEDLVFTFFLQRRTTHILKKKWWMTRCLLGYTTRRPSFFVTRDSYGDLDFKSYFQPET
jgi:hypothetical protein